MKDLLKWGLIAGGAFLAWRWWEGDGAADVYTLPGDPSAATPPPTVGDNTSSSGARPGSTPPDVPAPPPAPHAPAYDQSTPPRPPSPRANVGGQGTAGTSALKAAMQQSASGDGNLKSIWVWNWHFSAVTGAPELPVDQGRLFPGYTTSQVEATELSWDQWYSLMADSLPAQISL